MTKTLRALSDKLQSQREEILRDQAFKGQFDQMLEDTVTAKKRWRIMKTVVAAVVAGSGVDWARDENLRNLVLDEDSDVD